MRQLLILLFLSLSLTACSAIADLADIENGENGEDGVDGKDGSDGVGKDGTTNTTTTINYVFADSEFTHDVNALNSIATGSTTPANPVIPDDANNTQYQSFTAIADAAKLGGATDTIDVTLQGFAVMLNDTHIYKRTDANEIAWMVGDALNPKGLKIHNQLQLSRITSPTFTATNAPAVALRFDNQGAMSAVTVYADKAYSDNLTVDRSTIFGYANDSTSMAYISWNETQAADFTDTIPTATEINGIMLVGFESEIADLPTITTDITFTGKGAGVYSVFSAITGRDIYNTSFTATAIVNFTNHTADFSTTGTACSDDGCTQDLTKLNLSTGNLTFTDNHISTDILAGSLSGKLDARFYGANAWEFGGTFALDNADSIYYGAFGGQRTGIDLSAERAFDINHIAEKTHTLTVPNTDAGETEPYASIEEARLRGAYGTESAIVMNALAVYGDSRTDYARTANIEALADGDITPSNSITRLSGAAAKIDFNNSGNISAVTLYLDEGKIYTTTALGTNNKVDNAAITQGGNGAPENVDSAKLNLLRGGLLQNNSNELNIFGYDSDNIAYIDWNISKSGTILNNTNTNLIDADYDIAGMMVAGVETADSAIIDAGKTIFTGAGRGYATANDATRKGVTFTINANIDFSKTEITFASTASMECADATFGTCTTQANKYNFQTTESINYTDTENVVKNNISGAIKTTDVNSSYIGMADARFYGTGNNASTEFAGSFAMSDAANHHYYGVFGSELDDNYIISDEIQTSTDATINGSAVPPENRRTLIGFNDANRANKDDVTLPVASSVQITRNDDNNTITNEKISGGVTLFDYDGDGLFKGVGLTLYFTNKKYDVTDGTGGTDSITSNSVDINGTDDELAILNLGRNAFGFTANYMANLYGEHSGDESYSYGITGFETAGADIPKVSNAHFTG
ncbi:MAG: transferrin-binding protein-like solute binding protein, partial [Alphaproteobacteria bacterium]|nr:transferrin-binding protein-like solute binding protein [Alphaproteobacteria bacterium]